MSSGRPVLAYAVVTLSVVLVVGFSLLGRGDVLLFLDEYHSVQKLHLGYGYLATHYDGRGSGLALPLIQLAASDLFGAGPWAYRAPAVLGAIGAALVFFPVARRLVGTTPAAVAMFAFATSSLHVYYSRVGRSYSLVVFLGLVVVLCLLATVEQAKPRKRWFALLALAIGLMPFVHLVSVGFLAGVCGAAAIRMRTQQRPADQWRWMLGSVGAGAALALLLHLPARESIREFMRGAVGPESADFVHDPLFYGMILEVMAGSTAAGWVWAICLPIAAVWFSVTRRSRALLVVAGPIALLAVIFVLTPRGSHYAVARYLFVGLPFVLMLLAWLVVRVVRASPVPARLADPIAIGIGVLLSACSFAARPIGPTRPQDGPFANAFLSIRSVPSYDVAWDGMPEFYRVLARAPDSTTIIEAPILRTGQVYLYRNYYLRHRKRVILGAIDARRDPEWLPRGPYVSVRNFDAVLASGARYLVLHVDPDREWEAYHAFVDSVNPKRHATPNVADSIAPRVMPAVVLRECTSRLGEPTYADNRVVAWDLDVARRRQSHELGRASGSPYGPEPLER